MRFRGPDGRQVHLSYCTNVHAGEGFEEVLTGLREVSAPLRQRLIPQGELGIGLYLSDSVARLLTAEPHLLSTLQRELDRSGLYVATMNAFPFGAFHAPRVKEAVFRPCWNESLRVEHTLRCARILAQLAPDDVPAALSTHSGGPRHLGREGAVANEMRQGFLAAWHALESMDRAIAIAIEPEPDSTHESVIEVSRFLAQELYPAARALGLKRDHVGLCLDTCHAAVLFESTAAIRSALGAPTRVAKMQLSSALEVREPGRDPLACAELGAWVEPRWFHQVRGRMRGGPLLSAPDLETWFPAAQESEWWTAEAWRVHFHVPIFLDRLGALFTTREVLRELFTQALIEDWTRVFEIETYTFDRLPPEWRGDGGASDLAAMLEREFATAIECLDQQGFRAI